MAPRFRSVAGALASDPVAGVLRWTRVSILLASGSVVGVLLFFTTAGARGIFRDRLLKCLFCHEKTRKRLGLCALLMAICNSRN